VVEGGLANGSSRRRDGLILWDPTDSGGSDGRLVGLFGQAAAAPTTRSLFEDQRYEASLEGRLPVDDVRDRMGANLDAAVVLADRLDLFDLAGRRCFEIAFDIGMECRLVVLHGQKVVGLGIEDRLGDVGVASDGIDRDQGAGEIEALHKGRNGSTTML
jgi:hypothetical protein